VSQNIIHILIFFPTISKCETHSLLKGHRRQLVA
jgi:hypothetical protein